MRMSINKSKEGGLLYIQKSICIIVFLFLLPIIQKTLNCLTVALASFMGNSNISFLYTTITRAKGILFKINKI